MNKVYKVIWSKAKNCYVVASELAKSHTKSPKSGVMSRALVAGVLACVLSCGAVMPAYAEDVTLSNQTLNITGDYNTAPDVSASNTNAASLVYFSAGSLTNMTTGVTVSGSQLDINYVFPTIASVGFDKWCELVGNTFGQYEDGQFIPTNLKETTFGTTVYDDSATSISYRAESIETGFGNLKGFNAYKDPVTNTIYTFGNSIQTMSLSKTTEGYWTFVQEAFGGSSIRFTKNTSTANYVVLGSGGAIDNLTVNSSTLSATGDINVGSISSSYSTISASNIKTTSGDINASTSDLTATESVESAGVVKAKSVNASRLLGAGSGMSTLGGGLTVAGQVKGVTAGTADTDAVNVAQLNSAIAGASTPYIGINSSGGGNETGDGALFTDSIAIGKNAQTNSNAAIAIGLSSQATNNMNNTSASGIAIGSSATAAGGISIGNSSNTSANSLAIGHNAMAIGDNNISIGYQSSDVSALSASDKVVSFGHVSTDFAGLGSATYGSDLYRRLINVADGINDHDVATYGQVKGNISGLSVSGKTITYTKVDGTTGTITTQDTDTHYTTHLYAGSGTAANATTTNGNTKLTIADNTTARDSITIKGTGATTVTSANGVITINSTDNNTTYSAFTGATSSAAGTAGLVKAPSAGDQGKFLRGDGTWAADNNTHYTSGLYVGSGTKANAVTTNGNTKIALYDDNTARNTITIKGTGATSVTSDANGVITINSTDNNTTYSAFTGASASAAGSAGLVKAPSAGDQTKFLRGDGTWAADNDTTYSAATSSALGLVKIGSNITNSSGTISLTKANVTSALGYTPPTADTDTHYISHLYVGSGTAANAVTTNGNTKIALYDNSTAREALTIKGTGGTTVTSDANGVITINSTDANTTYSAGNGVSLSGTTFSAKPYNGITVDSNGIGVKAGTNVTVNSNGVSVTGSGSVASGNTGLISGGTLFTEGRITADGTFAKKANSIATNITALDTASKNAIKGLSVSGTTITYTKGDGTTGTITTQDNNTTYSAFTGATSSASGTAGLVKAPVAGDQNKFLRGDGTWATDNNTTYSAGTGLSLSGTTFSVNTNGSVASGNAGVLNGGTVYSEVRPTADGTFAKKANTTAANITALDTAAKNAIKALSVSGQTITYTKGDGTTGTITTQDTNTTYDNMSATELSTGTATTARSISAKTIADYVTGKVSAETTARNTAISSEATARADADTALGSRIDESIKGLSVSGKTITYTKGDGTTGTITTQDTNTTYAAGNGVALSGTTFSAKAGTNVSVDSNGINVVGNGSVASGNTGLVSGGTLFTENRINADGTFAKKANTTAANITALDTAAKNAIKALSVSGQTITYTKGDGTTGTITTQDNNTTYDNMSATELSTGTATTARSISAKTIADYVTGKVSAETTARTSAVSSEATTRANADTALGTRIDGTIKDLSVSGRTITYTKGDGTTGTITTQDNNTTYDNMSATELSTGTATTARSISAKVVSDYVTGKVSAETTARTTAINSEATTRANADTALGTRIDNAITAYESADTGLSNRIGSLSADGNYIKKSATNNVSANLTALDTQLKTTATALGTETTNRTNADTALGTRIDNVTSAYQSADTILGERIGTVSADGHYIKKSSTKDIAENLQILDEQLSTISSTSSSNLNTLTEADSALSNRIGSLASDGNYIKKSSTNNVIANLSALDTQLKATDTAALKYDGSNRELATLGGTNGTKLTNLKQGTLSASSTDAVTGAQLYSTNQSINGFSTDINRNKTNIQNLNTSVTAALETVSTTSELVDTINSLKADASLNNLTAAGRQVIATAAANAVQEYIASQQGSNAPMAPMMYSSSPTASNTLNITDAGNGSLHVGEGSYVNGTSSIAIGVGNQVNANNSGAFGDPSIIDADESYVLGNDDNIKTGATGSFIVGNDSVADAEGSMIFGSNVRSTGKNGMALGNNSKVSAENAVALGYGSVATEENTVSVGNGTLKRRITNLADGDVSEGSSDAVTGNQLHEISEYVKRKAEADASNIDVDKWSEKLATGVVEEGNTGLVNGGAVYDAMNGVANAVMNASLVKTDGENLFVGSEMGGRVVSVMNKDGESRVITGVATNPEDPSSAANVGYVNTVGQAIINGMSNEFTRVNDRMNKIGANAVALASLTPASFEGDEKWSLAASAGHYKGETAGAIGAFYRPTENVMMNVRGAFGNGENMIGAGVAVSLSKGDVPGLTKRQLAVTVNKQSEVIDTLQQERDRANARLADQERRIAELEKIVRNISNKK